MELNDILKKLGSCGYSWPAAAVIIVYMVISAVEKFHGQR